ncbi:NAD(P)H-binding protein [Arthrobacter bambusae]|nr:NAD(P)H-binding protein [Arthrobacter bambusae]
MTEEMSTVLVVGASGSIGQLAVAQALEAGFDTRALVRDESRKDRFPEGTEVVVGDLTDAGNLRGAIKCYRNHFYPRKPRRRPGSRRGGLRCRAQRPERPGSSGSNRPDDRDRGHEAHSRSRLEAPRGTARPGQRYAEHDRPPGLVRLQRCRPTPARHAARRHPVGKRSL